MTLSYYNRFLQPGHILTYPEGKMLLDNLEQLITDDVDNLYLFFEAWLKLFLLHPSFQYWAYTKPQLIGKAAKRHIDETTLKYRIAAEKVFEAALGESIESQDDMISTASRIMISSTHMTEFLFPPHNQRLLFYEHPIPFPKPDVMVLIKIQNLKAELREKDRESQRRDYEELSMKFTALQKQNEEMVKQNQVLTSKVQSLNDLMNKRIENQMNALKLLVEDQVRTTNENLKQWTEQQLQNIKSLTDEKMKLVTHPSVEPSPSQATRTLSLTPPPESAYDERRSKLSFSPIAIKGKRHWVDFVVYPEEARKKLKTFFTINDKPFVPGTALQGDVIHYEFEPDEIGTIRLIATLGAEPILGTPVTIEVGEPKGYTDEMVPKRILSEAGSLKFDQPFGIAFHGNLIYATDMDKAVVHVFNRRDPNLPYIKSIRQHFSFPRGLATMANGDLIVVDSGNNQIQILTPEGDVKYKFGSRGYKDGEFNNPRGVCLLPNDEFVVCDTDNSRIQIFTATGQHKKTIGSHGSAEGKFKYPLGAAYNPATGELAISDCDNHRIQFFRLDGQYAGSLGESTNPGVKFKLPSGIAFDPNGNMLIAELGENRVQVFDAQKKPLVMFGKQGNAPGEFATPRGLAIDSEGNIFVSDSRNRRIQVF